MSVKARTTVERVAVAEAAVVKVAMAKVTVIEITVMESAVTEVSAVRDERVMVEECSTAMPVVSPMAPTPTISFVKPEPESDAKPNTHSSQEESRLGIPSGIRNDRRAVYEPRIVLRHIDNFGIGRFNYDGVSLRGYLFLFIAIQVAGLVGLLSQRLDSVRYILLLVGICVAKR